jgi:cytochrome bd ubiquinol oxidase subunit II
LLSLEVLVAGSIVVALNLYMLMGGADYGGGVWDLLASGPRARQQRDLIAHAIGPIWEANHVWLILAITILFTGFPLAFSTITTFLHLPLLIMLIGIVFRGTAFAFRSYDLPNDRAQARWSLVFSISSLLTPILLGTTLGTIASGRLVRTAGNFRQTYVDPWLARFPLAVGLFALSLFSFLAAVYLTVEASEPDLKNDFRQRSLWSGALVGLMAIIVFVLARTGAPELRQQMIQSGWAWPLQTTTAIAAAASYVALWARRFLVARYAAIVQSTLIVWGWALAQFPNVIMPDLSIHDAAAPPTTLRLLVLALGAGAVILLPSFVYLLRIFKKDATSTREMKS